MSAPSRRAVRFATAFAACTLAAAVLTAPPACAGVPAAKIVGGSSISPTQTISVTGSGFGHSDAVDIYFDATEVTIAFANGSGALPTVALTVPASAIPGQHWISLVERATGKGAQVAMTVNTNWPEIGFTPAGRRANPYENVLSPAVVPQLQMLWSTALLGPVDGSPIIENGFVMISDGQNLYGLDPTTGQILTRISGDGAVINANVAFSPTLSPYPIGLLVYASGQPNVLPIIQKFAVSYPATIGGGSDSSPAVVGQTFYFGSLDSSLYAVSLSTQNEGVTWNAAKTWSAATNASIYSSPAVAGGVVYVGSSDSKLYAFNAANGTKLWASGLNGSVNSSPAVANGVVYAGSFDKSLYALAAETGVVRWSAATQAEIYSSPAVADGVVYVGSEDASVYAFDARTGKQLWSFATGGAITSSPAVADGVVYVGSGDGGIYAFDAASGALLWSGDTGAAIQSSPSVVNGVLYVGSEDGNVYAFAPNGAIVTPKVRPPLAALRPTLPLPTN